MSVLHRAVFTPKLPPRVAHLAKLYRDAPWQKQRQWIALFLLATVSVGMVAGVYLDITARAAVAGRQIQISENDIILIERANADLELQLAGLLSTDVLSARAAALGFQPAAADQLEYLVVAGYKAPGVFSMSNEPVRALAPTLSPEFTQSLIEWLDQQMRLATTDLAGN
jgi:hypothetical protein